MTFGVFSLQPVACSPAHVAQAALCIYDAAHRHRDISTVRVSYYIIKVIDTHHLNAECDYGVF